MPRALRARWLAPLSWLDQFEDAVPACHASECCELHPAATERRATNPASASACPSASPCDQNTRARRRDACPQHPGGALRASNHLAAVIQHLSPNAAPNSQLERFCGTFPFADGFSPSTLENKMSNFDNQPGRDNQAGFNNSRPENRTGLDRSTGIGTGTIAAIIAAVVIAGALMLFGPWGNNNRTAINNSGPASNSAPGTTTGQTSTSSRGVTPTTVTPAAPGTTAPANAR